MERFHIIIFLELDLYVQRNLINIKIKFQGIFLDNPFKGNRPKHNSHRLFRYRICPMLQRTSSSFNFLVKNVLLFRFHFDQSLVFFVFRNNVEVTIMFRKFFQRFSHIFFCSLTQFLKLVICSSQGIYKKIHCFHSQCQNVTIHGNNHDHVIDFKFKLLLEIEKKPFLVTSFQQILQHLVSDLVSVSCSIFSFAISFSYAV